MSTEIKKENKVIFPDQLIIIIRTSIPGFQKIEYKPSMTIKGSYEKGVVFDPLIKLNESVVNSIPQEYRIKQFFNKGLFQSLLNYNGGTPAKNLLQATRYGYVDNNINVTLNSIFPVGSVIYINNNSYVIADHQWTPGDWKIGIKDKFRVSEEKTKKIRELTGEEELKTIPESILVGINYSGPPIQVKKTQTASSPRTTNKPYSKPSTQPSTPTKTVPTTRIDEIRSPLHTSQKGGEYRSNYRQPYPYYSYPYYSYPYYSKQNYITKTDSNSSKLAYIITIDMELHPGTTLTPEQMSNSKCNSRYNAIRKSYSTLTRTPYVIPPLYIDSKNITEKNKQEVKGGRTKTSRRRTKRSRRTTKTSRRRTKTKTQRNMK